MEGPEWEWKNKCCALSRLLLGQHHVSSLSPAKAMWLPWVQPCWGATKVIQWEPTSYTRVGKARQPSWRNLKRTPQKANITITTSRLSTLQRQYIDWKVEYIFLNNRIPLSHHLSCRARGFAGQEMVHGMAQNRPGSSSLYFYFRLALSPTVNGILFRRDQEDSSALFLLSPGTAPIPMGPPLHLPSPIMYLPKRGPGKHTLDVPCGITQMSRTGVCRYVSFNSVLCFGVMKFPVKGESCWFLWRRKDALGLSIKFQLVSAFQSLQKNCF